MKVTKIKTSNVGNALGSAAGIAVGALASNAVVGLIPIDNATGKRALVAVAGALAASVVAGTDTTASIVRNVCIGMAGQQTKELVKEFATPYAPDVKVIKDALEVPAIVPAAAARSMGRLASRMGNAQLPVRMGQVTQDGVTFQMG